MSIHFNDTYTSGIKRITFYDDSAGTYTNIATTDATTANKSLFPDDFAVGDCIMFSSGEAHSAQYSGIRLNLDVGIAATSVVGVWEYAKRLTLTTATWTALSGVTDGTAGLTVTGQQDVTWTCPLDWDEYFILSGQEYYQWWVRFRITAVDTPTEGGHQSNTSILMRPYAIWADTGTTGTPCTFTDIYNADVAGSWGVVTKNSNQFTFNCQLNQSNTYYLSTKLEQIQFLNNFATDITGCLRIGTVYSADKCYQGSNFTFFQTNKGGSSAYFMGPNSYMYNSSIRFVISGAGGQGFWGAGIGAYLGQSVIDSYFEFIRHLAIQSLDFVLSGVKMIGSIETGLQGTVDGLVVYAQVNGWRTGATDTGRRIHRCDFSQTTGSALNSYLYGANNIVYSVVDMNFGTKTKTNYMSWNQPGTGCKVYAEASLLMKVVDELGNPISGATAVMKDKNGTQVFSYITNDDGYVGEDSGTVTNATSTLITDSSKSWTVNQWRWKEFYITSGTGIGQRKICKYHASAVQTVYPHINFSVTPSVGDKFIFIPYVSWLLLEPLVPGSAGMTFATETEYNPFTLTISKEGYESNETILTINKPLDEVITLKTAIDAVATNKGMGIKINRENLGADRDVVILP